jgi:hypothetical protein
LPVNTPIFLSGEFFAPFGRGEQVIDFEKMKKELFNFFRMNSSFSRRPLTAGIFVESPGTSLKSFLYPFYTRSIHL